jgi:hypothetical protein
MTAGVPRRASSIGSPERIQALVPPATLVASKPAAVRTSVMALLRLPEAHTT